MQYKEVFLKDIDFSDTIFKILPDYSDEFEIIFKSVSKKNILNPPFLIEKKGSFIIVEGFKRIAAALQCGFEKCFALVLDFSKESYKKAFDIINSKYLGFKDSESFLIKAGLYQLAVKITEIFSETDLCYFEEEIFGKKKNNNYLSKIKSFLESPRFLQVDLLNKVIALPVFLQIIKYEYEDIAAVSRLFNILHPGLNRQRELLLLLEEIAHIEDKNIAEIIDENELVKVMEDSESSDSVKLNTLLALLRKKRFPVMTEINERFMLLAKSSGLLGNPKISSSGNFENNNFKIEFSFNSFETYVNMCNKLNEKKILKEFKDFFLLI